MKLVIDIDENEYIGIKSFPKGNTLYPLTLHLYDAVRNGTPLPSGDLISRQAVIEKAYDMSEIDGEHFTELCMVVDVEDIQKLPSVN